MQKRTKQALFPAVIFAETMVPFGSRPKVNHLYLRFHVARGLEVVKVTESLATKVPQPTKSEMLYHETFLEGHVFVKAIRPLHETQCSKQPDLLYCKEANEWRFDRL